MHKGEEITIWVSREGGHVQNRFAFVSSSRQAVIWLMAGVVVVCMFRGDDLMRS